MKIHFVGHACIVVETAGTAILMDPWLSGKVFNDSWTLRPEPQLDPSLLDKIDYIWISHEHPDHCHFPSLNSFPVPFKQRVTMLFQERDHTKMLAAFKNLGYQNFRLLPHRVTVPLEAPSGGRGNAKIYCYHAGLMDSALAVVDEDRVVLNANDVRLSPAECRMIRRDLRHVDVLLNQFSMAAYGGLEPPEHHLEVRARETLGMLSATHNALGARKTIPFASFIYFSSEDNKYINPFANTVQAAYDHLARQGQDCLVLYPGDVHQVGSEHDSSEALKRYNALPALDKLNYDPIAMKPLEEIFEAYRGLAQQLNERYPKALLSLLGPITVRVPDLDKTLRFRFSTEAIEEVPATNLPDLVINSQPLWFGFRFSFGIQTLGASARFKLLQRFRAWKMHRILLSLNNGGVYLKPKYLFKKEFLAYLRTRMAGGITQALHYYRTSL
jgi:UDP-MurNAc hydroxylase